MTYHEFLNEFYDEDVLSFLPRELQGEKPEIIKAKLFKEALDHVVYGATGLEKAVNSSLSERKTTIKVFYECGGREEMVQCQSYWFRDGVDCEILKTDGQGWKKGKIRLRVIAEFVPDKQEQQPQDSEENISSSLDEIRKMADQ